MSTQRTEHTEHIERETKFEGTGVFDPEGLRGLPDVARVDEQAPEELDAVYYDTADLRLLAHGITLRRRRGGHDAGWHVKLPAAEGRREIHAPLHAGTAGHVPAELTRRITAYTRGQDVVPVVHLRTHRVRHLLLDRADRCLAEVAQDRVAAQVLGTERLHPQGSGHGTAPGDGAPPHPDAGTSTRLTHWYEIEVELDEGGPALARAAARRLRAQGWRPSPSAHKLDHALAADLPPGFGDPEPGRRPAKGTAGEAVTARFAEQLAVLLETDAAVRSDAPDAVHTMRSTSRRLRNLLRGHRSVLDRERTDPVAEELRHLTRVLGDSRDHEVLAARLGGQARELGGPGAKKLARRIAAQETAAHETAQRQAVAALDTPRYHALLDSLEDLRTAPPLRPGKAGKPAVAHLRKAAARDRRRLARRMAAAKSAPAGPERDQALHAARKAARRARHTAETALPYAGKRAERLRKRTKAVQVVLGDHQDAVMARAALPGLAARAHRAGADTYGYGRLHARQDELAREAREALPAVWRRARKPGLSRLR